MVVGGQHPGSCVENGLEEGREMQESGREVGMKLPRPLTIAYKNPQTQQKCPWHSQRLTVPRYFLGIFKVEQFEIIRTLQNDLKHSGNGHKKTLVKCNQLLAADQLSSWIAVGGGRGEAIRSPLIN